MNAYSLVPKGVMSPDEANVERQKFIEGLEYAVEHQFEQTNSVTHANLKAIVDTVKKQNWSDTHDLETARELCLGVLFNVFEEFCVDLGDESWESGAERHWLVEHDIFDDGVEFVFFADE